MEKKDKGYIGIVQIMFLILLSPIISGLVLAVNAEWNNSQPLLIRNIAIFLLIIYTILIIFIFPRTKIFSNTLKKSFTKTKKNIDNNDIINEAEIAPYRIKKKYNGKKVYTKINPIKGVIVISLCLSYIVSTIIYNMIDSSLIAGVLTILIAYYYFGRFIVILPHGIRSVSLFKNWFFPWEKIKTIGISAANPRCQIVDPFIVVYVSTKFIKSKQLLISKDTKGIITFKFRAKMIHHIMSFWDQEIVNLHNMKKWRDYIKREGILTEQDVNPD